MSNCTCRLDVQHKELDHLWYGAQCREWIAPILFCRQVSHLKRHRINELDDVAYTVGKHKLSNVAKRARHMKWQADQVVFTQRHDLYAVCEFVVALTRVHIHTDQLFGLVHPHWHNTRKELAHANRMCTLNIEKVETIFLFLDRYSLAVCIVLQDQPF